MRGFFYDLRLGLRSLSAARWTTAAAVLILALGTGVNTSVLAIAYGILLRPLPYLESSRVVVLSVQAPDGSEFGMPVAEFEEWQQRLRTVQYVAAYSAGEFTMRGLGEARVIRAALVTGDFFAALGVPGVRPPAALDGWVVLSEKLTARLGGNPSGRNIIVGQASYAVSGVAPADCAFPTDDVVAWLPSSATTAIAGFNRADARSFRVIARLKPGVSYEQARDDATRVIREVRQAKGEGARAVVTPIGEALTGRARPVLHALLGAAILVLLVACGNVASLFVGRAAARSHDLAVRLALGAHRWHLVRAVLAESLIVAVAASALGVWIALVLVRLFVRVASGVLPRLDAVAIDLPVMAATAGVAFAVTLLCGAAPALNAARRDFAPAFRGASAAGSRPVRRLRAALVVAQIALSIVLLTGAGLVIRTVTELLQQAGGIEARNVVSLRLVMTGTTTFRAAERGPFVKQVLDRVRATPGVRAAGVGSALPPRVSPLTIGINVVANGRANFQAITLASVTPGYLDALGARLVRGRLFRDADLEGTESFAMLSETAARHLSPARDPVGSPLPFPLPGGLAGRSGKPKVVGIVADIKYTGLDAATAGTLYVLWPDLPAGVSHLVVKAEQDPAVLSRALVTVLRNADPTLPVPEVRLLEDEILDSIADRRLRLFPAVSFAVLALLVALVGLSAAMTRAVAERRRELAIRGALGSSPARTLALIVREGALMTAAGVAVGLGASAAVGRALARLLYGVGPYDPLTFGAVAALAAGGSLLVCYAAARRALRVNLLELLRAE